MNGIILKDDARYRYTENYLRNKGCIFHEFDIAPQNLDFIIFPFKDDIVESKYDEEFFSSLKKDARVFSGIRNAYVEGQCEKHRLRYYPIMEERSNAIRNAVLTSEGVIAYLIANRKETVANSSILIIGYGVCGSDLCKKLKALGADVSALIRNREKECAVYVDLITPIYLEKLNEHKFDIIINTVPSRVLTNEMLSQTGGALLIDIASKPYGFDMEFAKKLNEKSALLPGIPGKYAVRTAGEILGEYIDYIFNGGK